MTKPDDYKAPDVKPPSLRASLADKLRAVAFDLTDVGDELKNVAETITDAESEEQKP